MPAQKKCPSPYSEGKGPILNNRSYEKTYLATFVMKALKYRSATSLAPASL